MGRPVRRRRLRTPLAAIVIALLLAALVRLYVSHRSGAPSSEFVVEGPYAVKAVVDGDTLDLENETRIRLIGSDTPETKKKNWPVEPFGPEATRFTERFIAGKPVLLHLDEVRTDDFGRTLAYVYVDGMMLNEALLRAGLARARTEFDYSASMKDLFSKAEQEARQKRLGIWSR